ncbi:MAG: phosphohydrolase [Lachnospiraceae bacterium]|nr:phosphohydrolase [Lachnospiraceae bacterium]
MSYITTVSGKHFDPIAPQEELLDINDIAHSLAMVCRANGHMRIFYSVAQHSYSCAQEAEARGLSREIILGCLLHDASEAYLSDVIRPVKKELPFYLEVEEKLQDMIWTHFIGRELSEGEKQIIFEIDDEMLEMEFHQLMPEEIGDSWKKLKRQLVCGYRAAEMVIKDFIRLFKKYALTNKT